MLSIPGRVYVTGFFRSLLSWTSFHVAQNQIMTYRKNSVWDEFSLARIWYWGWYYDINIVVITLHVAFLLSLLLLCIWNAGHQRESVIDHSRTSVACVESLHFWFPRWGNRRRKPGLWLITGITSPKVGRHLSLKDLSCNAEAFMPLAPAPRITASVASSLQKAVYWNVNALATLFHEIGWRVYTVFLSLTTL